MDHPVVVFSRLETLTALSCSVLAAALQSARAAGYQPTVFYPDAELWSREPARAGYSEEPTPLAHSHTDAYFVAPVETYLNSAQVLGIRPVSTALWDRV